MKDGMLDFSDTLYITEKAHKLLWKSEVHPYDILLSMSGTVGRVAIASPDYHYPMNSNQDIAKIHLREEYNPYYVYAFLRSRYGQNYLRREACGSVQQHVFLSQFERLEIPFPSQSLQTRIADVVSLGYQKQAKAQKHFHAATSILVQELGLDVQKPSTKQISVRSFREIFQTGRIDAEYYQPKYDAILQQLARISDGTIGTRCSIYDQNFTPDAATTYRYIELADIGNQGIITGCTTDTGDNLPTRARRIVHTGNLLVPSIEGSLQSMALVSDAYDSALCSTGFFVLDADDINSETLLVLFKSAPMQALLKRQCAGTILTGFDKDALCSIPLPVIPLDVQKQIQASVRQSFELRAQAVTLLATARRAVECFIEQGEAAALAVLASDSEA